MNDDQKLRRDFIVGPLLLVAAAVTGFFMYQTVLQAFRGPRTITEQELAALSSVPGDYYVAFTPARAFQDTGLAFGRKNNPGTRFLLLPVGDRWMLCSTRIADNGPTFVGRIEDFGGTEKEVLDRVRGHTGGHASPVMLQAVRSIWFDSTIALVAIVLCGLGGLWLLIEGLLLLRKPSGNRYH